MKKPTDIIQKNALYLKISELETTGAHRYDPVRFSYIRAMARRAVGKSGSIQSVIERKAMDALAEYRTNLETARIEAAEMVNRVCLAFPDAEIKIRELYNRNEFKKVLQLNRKLGRSNRQTALSDLRDQTGRFSPDFEAKNPPVSPSSVDDFLRQQELDVLASLGRSPAGRASAGEAPAQHVGKTELRSLKRFKETMMNLQSDRLVTHAIHDLPENSGPHNSQLLATSSLAALRQISPHYLNRFVAHIGTLIWLKQAGEDADKQTAKKARKKTTSATP